MMKKSLLMMILEIIIEILESDLMYLINFYIYLLKKN